MKKVDGNMWELFKSGTLPKSFYESPEVKKSLKEMVEQKKEDELLEKANKMAEKLLNGKIEELRKRKEAEKEKSRVLTRASTEELTDLERLNLKIRYNLINNPSEIKYKKAIEE